MKKILNALRPFDSEAKRRIMAYVESWVYALRKLDEIHETQALKANDEG